MIKIRASSLGVIMTEPKLKTEILSVGAKTYLKNLWMIISNLVYFSGSMKKN